MRWLAGFFLLAITVQAAEEAKSSSQRNPQMKNDDPGLRKLSAAKTFSSCEGPPLSFGVGDDGLMLTGLGAELKLSVPTVQSNYLWTYDEGSRRWVHGEGWTEMQFSADVVSIGHYAKDIHWLEASAHEAACTIELKDTHDTNRYRYDLSAPAEGNNTLAGEVSAVNHIGSVTTPWLASVDRVQSVVLSVSVGAPPGRMVALGCCALIPQMPTLPDEWAATIEANFLLPQANKMYTINRHEMSSRALDATRITSNSHDHSVVQIMRAGTGVTYTLHANTTFKQGVCEAKNVGKFEAKRTTTKDHHLKSTAELFGFESPNQTYVGPGCLDCEVRGVPCEKWSHHMNAFRPGGASYTVSYFFMMAHWRTKKKDMWHRHLMRVLLEGDHPDGSKVKHVYEFIDFNAITPKAADFDQCAVFATMYPRGDASACGCFGVPDWARASIIDPDIQDIHTCHTPRHDGSAFIFEIVKALLFLGIGILLTFGGRCMVDRFLGRSSKHQMFNDEKESRDTSNAAASEIGQDRLREAGGKPEDVSELGLDAFETPDAQA